MERRWAAIVVGDPSARTGLVSRAEVCRTVGVMQEGEHTHLEGDELEALTEVVAVFHHGKVLLQRVIGEMRLREGDPPDVSISGVLDRTNGRQSTFVEPEPIVVRAQAFAPTILADGEVASPPPMPALDLAAKDPAVAVVLELLSAPPTWVSLYQVFEVVEKDGGANFAAANDLDLFRHTANSYRAIGSNARHARLDWAPPDSPMSFWRADALIRDLVWAWIDAKRRT